MKINDEMIEAAAREIWKADNTTLGVAPPGDMEAWENETEGYLELARVVLEAALAVAPEPVDHSELIAEAKEWASSYVSWGDNGLVDRLVDALEGVAK